MFELVRLTLNPAPNVHRRYVFTTGDNNSRTAIFDFETRVREHFGETNGGTWDAYQVKRVRNVHQSLLSTPITAWLSLISIYEALTTPPKDRNTPLQRELYRFPHVITTNGPGNGVIVAIMARLLKIFFVAPTNCMRVVFIETWAHVETLSLTGKIFHWGRYVGGIADIFLVQHRELAEKYGYKVFDFITPRH
jgi:beta-1,4-N-acetylglucosaminyltransferase